MFFVLIIVLFILNGCQLQEPKKNHGIVFLKNRSEKLIVNKSNKNDVLNIVGQPHTKSVDDVDEWIYMERTLTKGEFHKLGQNILKENSKSTLQYFAIIPQKTSKHLVFGAGEGIRTLDFNLGKVALYP